MRKEKNILLRKTKKGSEYFQIQIGYTGADGKRKTYYESVPVANFKTKAQAMKEAVRKRDDAMKRISFGQLHTATPTVQELYEKKFEVLPAVHLKTRRQHDILYKASIADYADVQIGKITTADIQKCLNEYAVDHSDQYIVRVLQMWKQLYRCATVLGYDLPNRTDSVIVPKSQKIPKAEKNVIVSDEDFFTIINNMESSLDYDEHMIAYALQIMYYTGCRPAEALAIGREQIDLEECTLYISRSIGSSTTEMNTFIPTKTKQSMRLIPIVPELREVLEELMQESDTDPLIHDANRKPFSIDRFSGKVFTVSRRTKIKFNAYMCRHTVAKSLISSSANARVVQDILGHSNFRMSVSYSRSDGTERRKALEKSKLS